jgi:hypothetical protein
MQKNILIPTDFTVESLVQVKQAVQQNQGHQLNIILVYSCFLTDSISELLFYSPEKIIKQNAGQKFHEALSILKNKFPDQISSINIEVFHGYSVSYLETFIKKQNIDHIYIPKNYTLKETDNSFDIIPFIVKSSIAYTKLEWNEEKLGHRHDSLANLFF